MINFSGDSDNIGLKILNIENIEFEVPGSRSFLKDFLLEVLGLGGSLLSLSAFLVYESNILQ